MFEIVEMSVTFDSTSHVSNAQTRCIKVCITVLVGETRAILPTHKMTRGNVREEVVRS